MRYIQTFSPELTPLQRQILDLLGISPREFTNAVLSEPTHLWSDIILGKCGK